MSEVIEIATAEYLVIETPGPSETVEIVNPALDLVEVTEQGPTGAQGAQGPAGPQGDPGLSGANYVHAQMVPAATWNITHNLNRYPSVTVVDSAGSVVIGAVTYVSPDVVSIEFSAAFSGNAYLN